MKRECQGPLTDVYGNNVTTQQPYIQRMRRQIKAKTRTSRTQIAVSRRIGGRGVVRRIGIGRCSLEGVAARDTSAGVGATVVAREGVGATGGRRSRSS